MASNYGGATLLYKHGLENERWPAKQSTTTVIYIGQLLKLATGLALPMATNTDNADFCGFAMSASPNTDPSGTRIRTRWADGITEAKIPMDTCAATPAIGTVLKMAPADNEKLTALGTTTDADGIAEVSRQPASATAAKAGVIVVFRTDIDTTRDE